MEDNTTVDTTATVPQMQIISSEIVKDGMKNSTLYTLSGAALPEPIIRKYRDLSALRSKLVERWPGVVIQELPAKKQIIEKDYEEYRKEMLNRFCMRFTEIPFILNSEETKCFIETNKDAAKAITALPTLSYDELLKRFSKTFTNYVDNYDVIQGKANQAF